MTTIETELKMLRIEIENLKMLKGILIGLKNANTEKNPVAEAIARRKKRKNQAKNVH